MYWQPLSHSKFAWHNDGPPPALQLAGARIFRTSGAFGSICLQELHQGNYSLLLSILDLRHKFTGLFHSPPDSLHTRILLKGHEKRQLPSGNPCALRRHQFTAIVAGSVEKIAYDKDQHISFDIFFKPGMLREITPAFPFVKRLLSAAKPNCTEPQWADVQTLDAIHAILDCPHEEQLRRTYFFNNRVRDLLLNILVQSQTAHSPAVEMTDQEITAVQRAREIIVSNLADHVTIRELARIVLLNEYQFKLAFKTIHGVGPYGFLVATRMKKARELLLQGLSIKEVAIRFGYRPSVFTTSFRDFFGYPPSAVRRMN